MSTSYNFELKYLSHNADKYYVTSIGDFNLALILLHLTLSSVGMYITYRMGFKAGVLTGVKTLAGVLNASFAVRNNDTDTSSRREENDARPPNGGEG